MKIIKDKSDWVVLIVTLCVLQLISFWCIDISVSAMINQGVVTNGWVILTPAATYHIGLCISVISLVTFAFISIHHILKEE